MNTASLTGLIALVLVATNVIPVSALGISTGGPAIAVHFQFSQMAASGNNVYVTYQQNTDIGASVFFRKSSDTGSSFDKIIQLSSTGHAANPKVAVSGNNVYVVWVENVSGNGYSYAMFEQSSDAGNSFSAPIVLSNNTDGNSAISQIIASGSNVYVLVDDELQGNTIARFSFRASHDNGITFGDPITLLEDTQTRGFVHISVSEDGKTIYAFGEDSGKCPIYTMNCQYKIFLRKSVDSGLSFGEPIIIKRLNEQFSYSVAPEFVASEHYVYLVWGELLGDNLELFFAVSNNDGITFSDPVVLSQITGSSSFPHIVANGKNVFLLWDYSNANVISNEIYHNSTTIDSPESGIFFTTTTDGGKTFSEPVNLSGNVGTSYWSDITASGGNVYVAWGTKFEDKMNVFFRKSTDSGTTFDDAIKLTDTKQVYFLMQMISSGDNVYVAIDTALPGDDLFLAVSNNSGNTFENVINLNHDSEIIPEFPVNLMIITAIGLIGVLVAVRLRIPHTKPN